MTGEIPRAFRTTFGATTLLFLLSCGGSDVPTGPVENPVPTIVSITPDPLTFAAIGDSAVLQAQVLDQFGAPMDTVVNWTSSDESVVSVRSDGLVTAVANGTAVIEAVAGGALGTVDVSVAQAPATLVVSPDPIALNGPGDTLQAVATVLDSGGTAISGTTAAWTSGDPAVATVDASGLLTAVATGETTVTVNSEGLTSNIAVTVTALPASIEVTPDSVDFASLGDSAVLVATVRDGGGAIITGAGVQWASVDTGVVVVSDGTMVARGNGTTSVIATAGPVADTVAVEVSQVPASIQITPDPITLNGPGDTLTASGSVVDARGSAVVGEVITWTSSDEGVATVDAGGLVTGVSPGVATITAESGPLTSDVAVTVTQTPASIELSADSIALEAIGDTATVVATVRDAGGNPIAGASVTWTTSDSTVASVSAGLITASGFGTATITASAGSQTATAAVVVTQPTQSPSFSQDVNGIFVQRGCAANGCHGRGAGDLTISTNPATSYSNLVNVQASAEPTLVRVLPGDADNSYLVIKLEGRQASGGQMPIGGAPLSAANLATIKNWINAGAPNN